MQPQFIHRKPRKRRNWMANKIINRKCSDFNGFFFSHSALPKMNSNTEKPSSDPSYIQTIWLLTVMSSNYRMQIGFPWCKFTKMKTCETSIDICLKYSISPASFIQYPSLCLDSLVVRHKFILIWNWNVSIVSIFPVFFVVFFQCWMRALCFACSMFHLAKVLSSIYTI